mgnify:CR=1 FL=1
MTLSAPPTVTVRVVLFARYAEALGTEALALTVPAPARVSDAVAALRAHAGGSALPVRPLCAVNLSQVTPDHVLAAGDELAILPPMAGG